MIIIDILDQFGIFLNGPIIKNAGGPSGYIANLKEGLEINGKKIEIYYLSSEENKRNHHSKCEKKHIPIILELKCILHYLLGIKKNTKNIREGFIDKKILHVHSSEDLFLLKKLLKYKNKIILTPHRPEPFCDEVISNFQMKLKTKYEFPFLKSILLYIEQYAYKNADAFIFPSREAENIYNNFPGYTKKGDNKPVKYLITGAASKEITVKKNQYKTNIGNVNILDKVIVYIGRHNKVKGYDLIVQAFDKLKEMNYKIVCAGDLGINHPNDENWIELGRINDVQNLINCADIVLLPNRNTYFDLIAIEVLSRGKILIASNTGGNRTLANLTDGVITFENENINDMIKKIEYVDNMSLEQIQKLQKSNRNFYSEFSSLEIFSNNYLSVIDELYDILTINLL